MKYILFLMMTLSVFFVSCRNKELEKVYTISGVIYEDCSKTPLKNTTLDVTFSFGEGKLLNTPKTDANGKFIIQYNNYKSRTLGAGEEEITIYTPHESQIKRGIPPRKNLDLTIYSSNYASLTVNFNINNIQANDTLYYAMTNSGIKTKVNLTNNFSETLASNLIVQGNYKDSLGESVLFFYGIGKKDFDMAVNSGPADKTPYQVRRDIKVRGCGYLDTINVVK